MGPVWKPCAVQDGFFGLILPCWHAGWCQRLPEVDCRAL
ncbi:hypothetical protein EV13_1603 [Prochlorococcus sp. MIT 0702]|nr:hypothetical protein EV13_1603 [Prochlorococcus sp. MIT 0702]KGG36311.1 hypothetical protein EV14_0405 [Prochlorococcus sp. MIT 0703]